MKNQIQKQALDILIQRDWSSNAIITAATGVGKTKIAIDYLKYLYSLNPKLKVLIVVPTEKLRDENWHEEFSKWGSEELWTKVERRCYVSINKIENKFYDIVILDELQNITPNNSNFFNNNIVNKVLGLTATLPIEFIKKELLKSLKLKVVFDVPIDKAVELKLVAPYSLTIVETYLDNIQKIVSFGKGKGTYFLTEEKAYQTLSEQIELHKAKGNAKLAEMLIFKRMRVIYNSLQKTQAASYIRDNLISKDSRLLLFCGSIAQAKILCAYAFHSKTNDDDLKLFQEGRVNQLSCVNALNEGVNLTNVDCAIITQITSKERQFVQRVGRIIRYRENHIGEIYLLVCKNTVDEEWMRKALTNIEAPIKKLNYSLLKM